MKHTLISEPDGLDSERIARLRVRAATKAGTDLTAVGRKLLELFASEFVGEPGKDYPVLVGEPSGDLIEIALPLYVVAPNVGVTQVMNAMAIPSEYNYAESLVFESIQFPSGELRKFIGPQLGQQGVRKAFPKSSATLVGAILKPRPIRDLARAVDTVKAIGEVGVDFVVDDELTVETDDCLFAQRVERIVGALSGYARSSMGCNRYFANITARPSAAIAFAKKAKELGADGLVINPVVTGFGTLEDLALEKLGLPIVATNMGSAFFSKVTTGGSQCAIAESVMLKLTRMAGADAVHAGISDSDWYAQGPSGGAQSVLTGPLGKMPATYRVVAGGINIVNLIKNWPFSSDEHVMFEAGASVFAHKGGPRAGVRALATARKIAQEVATMSLEATDAKELALARVLKHSESDSDLEQAIHAARWQPDQSVIRRSKDLSVTKNRSKP